MSQMSFPGFIQTKVRPVKVGMVFEYNPGHHRLGRFWVKAELRTDFWETTELRNGAARNYSTDDILGCATATQVQPGQTYHNFDGQLCKIIRPVASYADSWKVERDGKMIDYDIAELSVLNWKPVTSASIKPKQNCPLCGSVGVAIFNLFDCSSSTCRNYSNRRGSP